MPDPTPPFSVKALYAYQNDYDDDLTFDAGQIISVTAVENDQWYTGTYEGKTGIFPRNFVELYTELPPVPAKRPTSKTESSGVSADPKPVSETANVVSEPKAASIPKPVLPGSHKTVDPYSVAKQFVATGKSSYVPQVTPRDQNNVIHTNAASHAPPPADIVRESTHTAAQDDEEPKVSLKERIALLKKRQEEEAEREAAAMKREEERKKKAAEKAKLRKEKALERHATGSSIASGGSTETARHEHVVGGIDEAVGGEETNHDFVEVPSDHELHPQEIEKHDGGEKEVVENADGAEQPEDDIEEEEDDAEEDAEDGEEEDEEEEAPEEDDEEMKRRKLVERMAKISGGRSMFGMMGMPSPFGQSTPASAPPKRTKSVKKTEEVSETPAAKPVPILPMAVNAPLPQALKKSATSPETPKSLDPKLYPESESSAMIEDDVATESDSKIIETEQDFKLPTRPSLASDGETDAYQPTIDSNIKITDTIEGEKDIEKVPAGYEADEDLSDITRTSTVRGVSTLESPVKKNLPPPPPVPQVPQVPQVPPIPTLPRLSTGLKNPPPPIPRSAAHPAVPVSAPPPPISTATSAVPPPIPLVPTPTSTNAPHLPPIPPVPPVPPVPTAVNEDSSDSDEEEEEEAQEDYDDTTSEEVGNRDISPAGDSEEDNSGAVESQTIPYGVPPVPTIPPIPALPSAPPVPSNIPSAPAVPSSAPPPPSNDDLTHGTSPRSPVQRISTDASMGMKSIKGDEQTNAELVLSELEFEIANITGNSTWWLKGELPDSLVSKAGSDLIYEVDSHELNKRGGRVVCFRDYYVLFYDLSQLVFEIEFEKDDPRSLIKLVNSLIKPVPTIHKDLLSKYRNEFGDRVVQEAAKFIGQSVSGNFVDLILHKFSNELVQPIGNKSCGVTIYKNFNNHNIAKIDEIKAGDILWMKNSKFESHKVVGNKKLVSVGDHDVHKSIIYEFDPRKDKIRVIEQELSGLIRKESYKLSEFKSGKLRVFRLVGRDYVDW